MMRSACNGLVGRMALMLALLPCLAAEAHLFHKVFELPDTQLSKDYWVLVQLIEFPNERFDLAAAVYRGDTRVRVKPGGFRKWLTRPMEPGLVFKADYQIERWSGTLADEVQRLDQTYGTALHQQITAGLGTRQAESVKQAFRQVFFYLLGELSEAMWEHLEQPEASLRLYQFFFRYFSVSLEAFLALNHRVDYLVLRTTLETLETVLGEPEKGIPPSPEMYQQHRQRFLRLLAKTLRIPAGAKVLQQTYVQ
jgi:hypothetical protein